MTWHVLVVIIVAGCSYAAWWQWHRAADGNTLSYLYSVEWPVFAVVAVIGWWQLVTEKPEDFEARREVRRQASLPKPVAYDNEVLRHELAKHPELVHAFPELTKAFPELASGPPPLEGGDPPMLSGQPPVTGAVVRGGPGGALDLGGLGEVAPAPSAEVRAYNEALGALAARGKAKTWRNPRGKADEPPATSLPPGPPASSPSDQP